jgi:hypothetical protein
VLAIEGPFWRDTAASDQVAPLMVLLAIGVVGFVAGGRLGALRESR